MTPPDDSQRDEPGQGAHDDAAGRDDGVTGEPDFEAAFRAIVAHYGDRATLSEPVAPEPDQGTSPVDRSLFDTSHLDGTFPSEPEQAPEGPRAWSPPPEEEAHFVPPDPPPLPRGTPARRLAWLGLFLPPLLMLAAVVFPLTVPPWASLLLVLAFVGGFVFLVATMPRDHGEAGDDGAVV